eukprot:6114854-Amphidinium_carterae.1
MSGDTKRSRDDVLPALEAVRQAGAVLICSTSEMTEICAVQAACGFAFDIVVELDSASFGSCR